MKVADPKTFFLRRPDIRKLEFNELNYMWNKAGIHPSKCWEILEKTLERNEDSPTAASRDRWNSFGITKRSIAA
jgi:hypothetical protein